MAVDDDARRPGAAATPAVVTLTRDWHGRLGYLALGLVAATAIAVPLVMPVLSEAASEPGGFAAVADRESMRTLLVSAGVMTVVVAGLLVAVVLALPAGIARREARVAADGLELRTRRRLWHAGAGASIPWRDVRLIRQADPGPHQAVVDLFVARVPDGLPPWVAVTRLDATTHGLAPPVHRLRIGARAEDMPAGVQALVAALKRVRSELFAQNLPLGRTPEGAEEAPDPYRRALPPPDAPIWVSRRIKPTEAVLSVAGITAVLALFVTALADPFGWGPWWQVPASLVLFVPGMIAVLMLPAGLWLAPRLLAPIGIRVGPEGVDLVQKQRWRLRTTRTRLPWDAVQAIVSRPPVPGASRRQGKAALDLVLADGPEPRGVGLEITATRLTEAPPDMPARLARFPALRLRLSYRPDSEERGDGAWRTYRAGGPAPATVAAHQLRPALYAFRPDLCRGFTDLRRRMRLDAGTPD